jgi:hypothetical protein
VKFPGSCQYNRLAPCSQQFGGRCLCLKGIPYLRGIPCLECFRRPEYYQYLEYRQLRECFQSPGYSEHLRLLLWNLVLVHPRVFGAHCQEKISYAPKGGEEESSLFCKSSSTSCHSGVSCKMIMAAGVGCVCNPRSLVAREA